MGRFRHLSVGLTLATVGLWLGPTRLAHAEVKQPDGTVIPVSTRLQEALATQGETIDPLTQAAVTPETFDPACKLEFRVVARGGGQKNSFGWYNVTGKKPALADLHEFLGCDDAVGTQKTLAIRDDPKYLGGRIAFFEATTQGKPGNCVKFGAGGPDPATLGYVFYSEKAYNEDNNYHLLILDSGKFKNAFYFGWEDLKEGNDNDFEDLLTRVDGIQCAGGGEVCDTGQKGICGVGILQCKAGKLTCVPQNASRAEACNGLDDDCNGAIDDSPECSCTKGEFACTSGKTCAGGVCVDTACVGKTCAAGEVCAEGSCKAPCAGVICPASMRARASSATSTRCVIWASARRSASAASARPAARARPRASASTPAARRSRVARARRAKQARVSMPARAPSARSARPARRASVFRSRAAGRARAAASPSAAGPVAARGGARARAAARRAKVAEARRKRARQRSPRRTIRTAGVGAGWPASATRTRSGSSVSASGR
jgi:hypothetical protein